MTNQIDVAQMTYTGLLAINQLTEIIGVLAGELNAEDAAVVAGVVERVEMALSESGNAALEAQQKAVALIEAFNAMKAQRDGALSQVERLQHINERIEVRTRGQVFGQLCTEVAVHGLNGDDSIAGQNILELLTTDVSDTGWLEEMGLSVEDVMTFRTRVKAAWEAM